MPKVTYTPTKGLETTTGSGFHINGAALYPQTESSTHTSALYTLTLTTAHNGGGGSGEDYDEKYFTIEDRDGSVYGIWFDKNTSTIPTALTDLSPAESEEVQLGSNADKTPTQIGAAIVTAINSTSTTMKTKFFAINTSGVVTIYVLETGKLANAVNTTANTTAGDIGDITDNSLALSNDGAGNTLAAGSSSISLTLGNPVANVNNEVAIPDGSVLGQKLFIQCADPGNNAQWVLTGKFYHTDGSSARTKATVADNTGVQGIQCIWSGAGKWWIINSTIVTLS